MWVCGGGGGRALTLITLCAWPGTPEPQVTWRKGASSEPLRGRPGLAVLDEGSLFLASVSPSDGGDYECQATNEAGSASRRAKLVVYGEQGPQSWGVRSGPRARELHRGGCMMPAWGRLKCVVGRMAGCMGTLSPERPCKGNNL